MSSPPRSRRRDAEPALRRAPEVCVCLAARQLSRQLTQYYERMMTGSQLSIGQFSILAKLDALGPKSVAELAQVLALDRKSLGLALRPLERDGLLRMASAERDRRRREIALTEAGREKLAAAMPQWRRAQAGFAQAYGEADAKALRRTLRRVLESMQDAGLVPAQRPAPGGDDAR